MSIYKTRFTITVLSEGPVSPGADIQDVLREMESGSFLGDVEYSSSEEVPADRVEEECVAVGNDGAFFMEEDDE